MSKLSIRTTYMCDQFGAPSSLLCFSLAMTDGQGCLSTLLQPVYCTRSNRILISFTSKTVKYTSAIIRSNLSKFALSQCVRLLLSSPSILLFHKFHPSVLTCYTASSNPNNIFWLYCRCSLASSITDLDLRAGVASKWPCLLSTSELSAQSKCK